MQADEIDDDPMVAEFEADFIRSRTREGMKVTRRLVHIYREQRTS